MHYATPPRAYDGACVITSAALAAVGASLLLEAPPSHVHFALSLVAAGVASVLFRTARMARADACCVGGLFGLDLCAACVAGTLLTAHRPLRLTCVPAALFGVAWACYVARLPTCSRGAHFAAHVATLWVCARVS
mgnify:FL=1